MAPAPGAGAQLGLPPDELLTTVWGDKYQGETRFLTLWIQRLRVNLGDDPDKPEIVLGNIEKGYRLAD